MAHRFGALMVAALLVPAVAAGDVLVLKSGKRYVGTVTDLGHRVRVVTPKMKLTFPKSVVKEVITDKRLAEEFARRLKTADAAPDVEREACLQRLLSWCRRDYPPGCGAVSKRLEVLSRQEYETRLAATEKLTGKERRAALEALRSWAQDHYPSGLDAIDAKAAALLSVALTNGAALEYSGWRVRVEAVRRLQPSVFRLLKHNKTVKPAKGQELLVLDCKVCFDTRRTAKLNAFASSAVTITDGARAVPPTFVALKRAERDGKHKKRRLVPCLMRELLIAFTTRKRFGNIQFGGSGVVRARGYRDLVDTGNLSAHSCTWFSTVGRSETCCDAVRLAFAMKGFGQAQGLRISFNASRARSAVIKAKLLEIEPIKIPPITLPPIKMPPIKMPFIKLPPIRMR